MNTDKPFSRIVFSILAVVLFSLMLTGVCTAKEEKASAYTWLDHIRNGGFVPDTEAGTEQTSTVSSAGFNLPASLQVIEDEAFEGTAIVSVDLPETVESIGERAFADIPTLRSVRIPEMTKEIARTAFSGSSNVTITAAPNSYARTWARENGIPLAPIMAIYAGTGGIQISAGAYFGRTRTDIDVISKADEEDASSHWRPIEEIQADQYDQCIANCILGRAPPACA